MSEKIKFELKKQFQALFLGFAFLNSKYISQILHPAIDLLTFPATVGYLEKHRDERRSHGKEKSHG